MKILAPPGVYGPQGDSRLLAEALSRAGTGRRATGLDLCTGSGFVALASARLGTERVHAVDLSAAAVLTARLNARLHGLPVSVFRGNPFSGPPPGRFQVVTANPPYVPCSPHTGPASASRSWWDGGEDGRVCVDAVCARAPEMLTGDGVLLMVHSALCGTDRTVAALRERGLKASVAVRRRQPFGPVLLRQADWLEERGLIEPGEREEELVVIRAERTASAG